MRRLLALVRKEFVQLKRDRRTLAMLIMLPVLWLVAFGYAVNFDIEQLDVAYVDEAHNEVSTEIAKQLRKDDHFQLTGNDWNRAEAKQALKEGQIDAAIVIPRGYEWLSTKDKPHIFVDGSQLFSAQAFSRHFQEFWSDLQQERVAELKEEIRASMTHADIELDVDVTELPQVAELSQMLPPEQFAALREGIGQGMQGMQQQLKEKLAGQIEQRADEALGKIPDLAEAQPDVDVLYNEDMKTVQVMIPGLVGLVLIFITTLMTALGIVKEKERGTLEQLVVSPLSSLELMLGKVLPYVLIATVDFLLVFLLGVYLYDVPFKGSFFPYFLVSLVFLVCSLGIGLLVSTVSVNQQQAMQLAVLTLVPQIILSGFIFPLEAMPWGIRWVAYLLPLTYYVPISRGEFLKGAEIATYAQPALILAVYALLILLFAVVRFRRGVR
ncbi:ABC transporter permease [Numidum massiliense]|uniref:ABC transporter permease n=1 Tax=Numidum massiliense TaxID=1522315 RepID=UPI000AA43F97|nr:ABC transporter permease [Numidum massiliense]